jgi:tetratricopeptide (TPR) repeat protein
MTYDWIAENYLKLGMFSVAEKYWRKALEEKPHEACFHYNLSRVYSAQKNFKRALDALYNAQEYVREKKWKKKIQTNIEYYEDLLANQ